jgi:hypothetical protein
LAMVVIWAALIDFPTLKSKVSSVFPTGKHASLIWPSVKIRAIWDHLQK